MCAHVYMLVWKFDGSLGVVPVGNQLFKTVSLMDPEYQQGGLARLLAHELSDLPFSHQLTPVTNTAQHA